VPYRDLDCVVRTLASLVRDREQLAGMAEAARLQARLRYGPRAYQVALHGAYRDILGSEAPRASDPAEGGTVASVASVGDPTLGRRVSVVVPNYNYARYLPERIESIRLQTVRPHEVIFLDDCSSDDSVEVARRLLADSGLPFGIIANASNRGVYHQWRKGIAEASGDVLWIAEADDVADPRFIQRVLEGFGNPGVVLSYAQSRIVDERGHVLRPDTRAHTDGVDPRHWLHDYVEVGVREVLDYLVYRNTIPNVSACLFDRRALLEAVEGLEAFRFCGDWYLYCRLLRGGSIAFVAEALNDFRRHADSVTRSEGRRLEYLDELVRIKRYVAAEFPLHERQLEPCRNFLDADYRIEGVAKNSRSRPYREFARDVLPRVSTRRRFAFLTTNNGSFNGGSEVLWVEAAKRLAAAGNDVIALMKRWEPEPPFMAEFRSLGIRVYFREDGFDPVTSFLPDLLVISTGDQDEGVEWYEYCEQHAVPYVIVNQLTKPIEVWPLQKRKLPGVRKGYRRARKAFFTCRNNHRLMEQRLGTTIANADFHHNPFHIDRGVELPFPPVTDGFKVAVPARLLKIHKGQHLVLEVLSSDKWRSRPLSVTFYGDGPDKA